MKTIDNTKKAYYRTFQGVFNVAARCLYWRKPELITGVGCVSVIPSLLAENGISKVLIVTGPNVVKSLGPLVMKPLDDAGIKYEVFSEVEANPSVTTVDRIQAKYLETDCRGFIALGGGSPMDAAKAAAARVVRPSKSVNSMAGLLKVGKNIPTFIAIPTTSGTGSETTIAAIITDRDTDHKYAIMDLHLIPHYAVLDPQLTVGLPPRTTATTGMDALTHAVEAYVCWTYNTHESLRDAEEAVRSIFVNLEKAYSNPDDLNTRQEMMVAAYKAGFAFTRAGVGNVHAIAHTLGGIYNTPHGLANSVILPIVLEDYGEAVYEKLARLSELAMVKTYGSDEEKAKAFIAEIRAMNKRMGLPTGFDFIRDEDIPRMVKWALAEANPVYPVPVVYTKERCRRVIERIRAEA
ncbi:MAG: iron-containing alcohol dehydrogenase [Oscillospiraceae bacterium]